jgi:FMN phosphatase YigB (HAD superfamily)
MDEKGLGKRLQDARKAAGMTQQELCHQAQLSYSTLAKIERGAIKAPSVFTIQDIAVVLGMGVDALLGTANVSAAQVAVAAKPKHVAQNGARFIFFDVNGCLVRFFQAAFSQLAADSGVRADQVENFFWHYNDAVCRGDMTMEEFNAALGKQLNMPRLDWMEYYLSAVEPIESMHKLVAWAGERYHIGLVTNIMPGFIDAMQARGLLPNVHFDAIIDSSQVGAIKPEREIYEVATRKAGVDPHQIMLIDDDRSNLMAAERFGWHVMWFDDYRSGEAIDRIRDVLQPAD